MTYEGDMNIYVGGKLGIFKGLKIENLEGEWKGISKNIQNVNVLEKDREITAMAWGDTSEIEVLLGLSNQTVKIYNTDDKAFTSSLNCNCGTGTIIGICRFKGSLVTAVESGHIKVWTFEDENGSVIETDGPLQKMRHNPFKDNIIATGGKEKDLQLWDLETKTCVFTAKNVRHDELELRVPVWVSDMGFMPDSQKVALCSRYGHVRLYDPSTSQRRPVISIQIPNRTLTAISVAKENHVIVGSGTGHMMMVDFRGKGLVSKPYKGSVGSIRSITCHPTEPYVSSVGLDRHIKIHHVETGKLLYKEYLKIRLNCVLMRKDFSGTVQCKTKTNADSDIEIITLSDEESNVDELFSNMEAVVDAQPRKKKRKECINEFKCLKVRQKYTQ